MFAFEPLDPAVRARCRCDAYCREAATAVRSLRVRRVTPMRASSPKTPGIEALVERQAERWRLTAQQHAAPLPVPQPSMPQPSIAFSQLAFSSGEWVAARVAARLDFG